MGLFNTISASLECPRCRERVDAEVHVQVGYAADSVRLAVGDLYPGLDVAGVRPLSGNLDAEGWCVCPACDADFFCRVEIRRDRVAAVAADRSRFPLGHDAWIERRLFCPRDRSPRTMEVRLFAGHASPARRLHPGDAYLADEFPGLEVTLRALGVCADDRDQHHQVALTVRVASGRIADVEADTLPARGRIFLP